MDRFKFEFGSTTIRAGGVDQFEFEFVPIDNNYSKELGGWTGSSSSSSSDRQQLEPAGGGPVRVRVRVRIGD